MNNNKFNIHRLLTSWGESSRQLPSQNDDLKREVLVKVAGLSFARSTPSRKIIPWSSLSFAGVGIAVFLFAIVGTGSGISSERMTASMDADGTSVMPSIGNTYKGTEDLLLEAQFQEDIAASDTREFLRTDYNAHIKTRRVEKHIRRIETLIHSIGGRIDRQTVSEEHGYIEFVIPANVLTSFRDQIENIVPERFMKEEIHIENLLPQKQAIEKEKSSISESLEQYTKEQAEFTRVHAAAVSSLRSQINTVESQLAMLQSNMTGTSEEKTARQIQIQKLQSEKQSLANRLAQENAAYAKQVNSYDTLIADMKLAQENNNNHDLELLDTIATVRGTISVDRISVLEVVLLYVSLYWISAICIAFAGIMYALHKRRLKMTS